MFLFLKLRFCFQAWKFLAKIHDVINIFHHDLIIHNVILKYILLLADSRIIMLILLVSLPPCLYPLSDHLLLLQFSLGISSLFIWYCCFGPSHLLFLSHFYFLLVFFQISKWSTSLHHCPWSFVCYFFYANARKTISPDILGWQKI